MYNFVKLYVIPIAFALLAVWLCQSGTDILDAAMVCGLMHGAAQVMLYTLKDIYDSWLDERGERHLEAERPARHEDITLDDLNALLERIDRGEDGVPDSPLLTTNERRERLAMMASDREMEMSDQHPLELRRTNSYATFYAGDAAYIVIPNAYGTTERR